MRAEAKGGRGGPTLCKPLAFLTEQRFHAKLLAWSEILSLILKIQDETLSDVVWSRECGGGLTGGPARRSTSDWYGECVCVLVGVEEQRAGDTVRGGDLMQWFVRGRVSDSCRFNDRPPRTQWKINPRKLYRPFQFAHYSLWTLKHRSSVYLKNCLISISLCDYEVRSIPSSFKLVFVFESEVEHCTGQQSAYYYVSFWLCSQMFFLWGDIWKGSYAPHL